MSRKPFPTALDSFIRAYIDNRTDVKECTRVKFDQARKWAVCYFGESRELSSITPADFEMFLRWMTAKSESNPRPLAKASANKNAKRLRQFLDFARKLRLIGENVGKETKLGGEVNNSRMAYIDRRTAAKFLARCPSIEWKLIFALPRFCGLRCPTEVLGLRWTDIDWSEQRMRIESVKTGLRYCPIFPEILPLLREAFESADDGSVHVIANHRGNECNLRTHVRRIAEQAGIKPWPKTFVNLRSSCRTDLEDRFRDAVIDAWLGHSTRVARKHYSQVRESDWQQAVQSTTPKEPTENQSASEIISIYESANEATKQALLAFARTIAGNRCQNLSTDSTGKPDC